MIKKIQTQKRVKKKGRKQFRLRGKHLFLTYAKTSVSREQALEELKKKLEPRKVENYVLATEKHHTGEDHVHVYFKLDKECDITAPGRLDLGEGEGAVHGNYQSCRSWNGVLRYVLKGGMKNVLTNMNLTEDGRVRSVWGDAVALAEKGEVKASLDLVKGVAVATYLKDYKKLRANAQAIKEDSASRAMKVYAVKTFEIPEEVQE